MYQVPQGKKMGEFKMKVEIYERLLENVEAFEKQKITLRRCHEIAVSEVTEARKTLSIAAAGGQVKEVVEAQARLAIAEEKLRKTPAVDSGPKAPKGAETAYDDVRVAISTLKGQGAFMGELQPLLDELGELRSRYISTLTAFLKKQAEVNTELSVIQQNAKEIQKKYTKNVASFNQERPPSLLADEDFRRWIWIDNDYRNEIFGIRDRVLKESGQVAPIKVPPNKRVLQEQPLFTQGQHSINENGTSTSVPRCLGVAPIGRYSLIGGD